MPYDAGHTSIFEAGWPTVEGGKGADAELVAEWEALRGLRDTVNKAMEEARAAKTVGASLEAKLLVHSEDPTLRAALDKTAGASNGVDELR